MKRRSPYKRIRIENVTHSELLKDNEDRWKLVTPSGTNIFRIWVMGVITGKYTGENNYVGLKVDDGTGELLVKTWDGRLDLYEKWDKVEILGQVQVSEREEKIDFFLVPDIIKKITDDNWFLVHRLSIIQQRRHDDNTKVKSARIGDIELGVASIEDLKIKLKISVKKFDKGKGVTYDQLAKIFTNVDEVQIDEAITELLESGEFFEPRAGVYSLAIDL